MIAVDITPTAAGITVTQADPRRALEVRALQRIRMELEAQLGKDWGRAELEAGALLADVCNQLGLTGSEQRRALGARYDMG